MAKEQNTAQIIARVTESDRNWLDHEAARQGLAVSSLVRMTLRRQRLEAEAAERGLGAGSRLGAA